MGVLDITVSTLALFLLLQQPWLAKCYDFLGPIFSPIVDDLVCGVVPCGQGNCKTTTNKTFPGYECECDPGWNRVGPQFMPCVIPNCTVDYSCTKAPGRGNQGHLSPIDPCFYANCGGGVCNNKAAFPYVCECDEGYGNMLNMSVFSCVKDCALGMDCNHLDIPLQNNTVTPNNTDTNNTNGEKVNGTISGVDGSLMNCSLVVSSSSNLVLLLVLGISSICMIPWR